MTFRARFPVGPLVIIIPTDLSGSGQAPCNERCPWGEEGVLVAVR
jgi:hypothetical protein